MISAVYEADHYHCRYCGEKVILTPVIRLLARLYPEQFLYHAYWTGDSTHPAFVITESARVDYTMHICLSLNASFVEGENRSKFISAVP